MTRTSSATRRQERRAAPDYVSSITSIVWGGSGVSMAASVIMLGWLSLYATDTLGLSAATIGFVIAGCQILNVIGSLITAYIVDRSPVTRWGKARPFEIAIPIVWLATIALFATPADFNETARTIWVGVLFVLIQGVFDPFLRANDALYTVRAFANRGQWAKVISVSGFVTMVGVLPVAILLPILLGSAGKDPGRWLQTVAVVAVIMTVVGLVRFVMVKEKHGTADDGEPPVAVREMVAAIRSNHWIWLYATLPFVVSAASTSAALAYYFRYIVGDLSFMGILGGFAIAIVPLMLFLPKLMRRFSLSRIMMCGAALAFLGNAIGAMAWGNLTLIVIGSLVAAVGILPCAYLQAILLLDLCSYNEWKGNRRLESTIGALTGIFGRLGAAFAAGLTGIVLGAAGYDGTLDEQSPTALTAINALCWWLPAALLFILALAMFVYGRFDRVLMPRVRADLDARGQSPETPTEALRTNLGAEPVVVSGFGVVSQGEPPRPPVEDSSN